jgi:hypothetical protein
MLQGAPRIQFVPLHVCDGVSVSTIEICRRQPRSCPQDPKPLHFSHLFVEATHLNRSAVALFGGVVAGLAAYGSTALLMLLFRRREVEALGPFGYYCIVAGLLALLVLLVR